MTSLNCVKANLDLLHTQKGCVDDINFIHKEK